MAKKSLSRIFKSGEIDSVQPLSLAQVSCERNNFMGGPLTVEREAYEKGFEVGERAGLELGQEKINALIRRLSSIIDELIGFKERYYAEKEEELAGLVMTIARKVVHAEVSINREVVVNVVKAAIDTLTTREEIILRLNPEDLEYLMTNCSEFMRSLEEIKGFNVESDSYIGKGGCMIKNSNGEIDARIEEGLNTIENAMKETLGK